MSIALLINKMSAKFNKPLLPKQKLKSLAEMDVERKEKEERFKEIAFHQPTQAPKREVRTPQERQILSAVKPKVRSQQSPRSQFLSPKGMLSPNPELV
jgi:hypothetical protein